MRRPAALALVALAALATWARAPWNGWAVDDVILAANPLLRRLGTIPAAMMAPWWQPSQHLYRPLATGAIGLLLVAAHGAPWLPHLVNVGLHALVAVLVTRLCMRWLPLGASLAAGLFFAVLPAHGEGVATLVAIAELMNAAALVAMLLVVTESSAPTRRRHLAIAVLSAAALASKEGGVAAPVLALGAAWAFPPARTHAWRFARSALAGTVVMLLARVVVLGELGGDVPHALFRTLTSARRVAVALALLPRTATMLFLPVRPAINYVPPMSFVQSPPVLMMTLGTCMVVGALVLLVLHVRHPSVATLGMLVMSATLAPTANLLFASGVVLSGRSVYSPSIGAALMVGALVAMLMATRVRKLVPVVAAALVAMYAVRAWHEAGVWRSSVTVLEAAGERGPDNYWVPMGRAYLARDAGDRAGAITQFRSAAEMLPLDWEMLTDGASVALSQGDTVDAERWLRQALAAHPRATRARVRLAGVTRARGDTSAARRMLAEGLLVEPGQRVLAAMLGLAGARKNH